MFDYYHLGHLRLFKQCRQYADYLIVAVQNGDEILKYKSDAEVLYSTQERVELIEAVRFVDKVIIYDSVSPETLEKIDFDILALGEDHHGERFDIVTEWCRQHNKEVVRLKRTENISSSHIKQQLKAQK